MKATILATISLSALLGACTTTTYYHPPRAHMTYDSHAIGNVPTTETKKETKVVSSKEVKDVSEKKAVITESGTKNTAPFCVTIKKGQGLAGNGVSSAQAYAAAYVYNVPKLKNGEPNFKVGDTFCIDRDGAVPKKEKK